MVVVRVPKHDEISLTTALDAGAAGIIIPHCESADDVRAMIKEMYYRELVLPLSHGLNSHNFLAPTGQRSFSPWIFTPGVSDASLYPNDNFNIATANKHVCKLPL